MALVIDGYIERKATHVFFQMIPNRIFRYNIRHDLLQYKIIFLEVIIVSVIHVYHSNFKMYVAYNMFS